MDKTDKEYFSIRLAIMLRYLLEQRLGLEENEEVKIAEDVLKGLSFTARTCTWCPFPRIDSCHEQHIKQQTLCAQ